MERRKSTQLPVVDEAGRPQGIFTDGDLRRALEKGIDVRTARVSEVMKSAIRV